MAQPKLETVPPQSSVRHKVFGSLSTGWGTGKYYFLGFKGGGSALLTKEVARELARDLIEFSRS